MKKSTVKIYAGAIVALSFVTLSLASSAQKLPNTQKISLRAPADIKVDGKATEWDNKFQAYNKSTDIYYTISNDDDKLYLTVHATDLPMITKLISGGLSLTVQKSGKKTDKGGINITYPVFNKKNRPAFNLQSVKDRQEEGKLNTDSIIRVYNNILGDKAKTITVTGVPGLDSVISVYNTDGIKTAQLFDNQLGYTYELSIDLKNLGLSANNEVKFTYHINVGINVSSSLMSMMSMEVGANGSVTHGNANPAAVYNDFWGEYTLAKK